MSPNTEASTREFVQNFSDSGRIQCVIFYSNVHVRNIRCTPNFDNEHSTVANVIGADKFRGTDLVKLALGGALSYLFDELKLHRIEAGVYTNHPYGIALLTSLGFEREAVMKERILMDGARIDLMFYGLLRDRWPKLKNLVQSIEVVGPTQTNSLS